MTQVDQQGTSRVALICREQLMIADMSALLDMIASAAFEYNCDKIIIKRQQFAPAFYDLSSGLMEQLRERLPHLTATLAIVGTFQDDMSEYIAALDTQGPLLFFADEASALHALHTR